MITTNKNFTLFKDYQSAIDEWDKYDSFLITWIENGKLKTTNSKGKIVNLTKSHCKNFDNPEKILNDIKFSLNCFEFLKYDIQNEKQEIEKLFDDLCFRCNFQTTNLKIRLLCLLLHLLFENITLKEFEFKINFIQTTLNETTLNKTTLNNNGENLNDSSDDDASFIINGYNKPRISNSETQSVDYEEPVIILNFRDGCDVIESCTDCEIDNKTFYNPIIESLKQINYQNFLNRFMYLKHDFNLLLSKFDNEILKETAESIFSEINNKFKEKIINDLIDKYVDTKRFNEQVFENIKNSFENIIQHDKIKIKFFDYFEKVENNYCIIKNNFYVIENNKLIKQSNINTKSDLVFRNIKKLPNEYFNLKYISLQLESFVDLKISTLEKIVFLIFS